MPLSTAGERILIILILAPRGLRCFLVLLLVLVASAAVVDCSQKTKVERVRYILQ